jgi:hypothetical protein
MDFAQRLAAFRKERGNTGHPDTGRTQGSSQARGSARMKERQP